MAYRIEHDTMGAVKVPANKKWGAQTERSIHNFNIGTEKMPLQLIHAYGHLKAAAARVNNCGNDPRFEAIETAAREVAEGKLDQHFPLSVWQTGSGTQTNMNLNEVIAFRATELLGLNHLSQNKINPNDDVNRGQSSNDTFPTAMKIATVFALDQQLSPALNQMVKMLGHLKNRFQKIIKVGRTHLQDATPITLGAVFGGYESMIQANIRELKAVLPELYQLPIGGTAVGTGLNAPKGFDQSVCDLLRSTTGYPFVPQKSKPHGLTAHDPMVVCSGCLKALAANLMKIANDMRWLASGPRCGIGELIIPANEPGSSIMPGKVNPTQAEALTMIATQVFGNDATITFAASQGNFELNVFKPVIIYNILQSITLLSDSVFSFTEKLLKGIKPNKKRIDHYLEDTLMLVTALNPHIGYENGAKIAKKALLEGITLKEATLATGLLSEKEFDQLIDPKKMV